MFRDIPVGSGYVVIFVICSSSVVFSYVQIFCETVRHSRSCIRKTPYWEKRNSGAMPPVMMIAATDQNIAHESPQSERASNKSRGGPKLLSREGCIHEYTLSSRQASEAHSAL